MLRLNFRIYRLVSALRHWMERRFTPAGFLVLTGMLAVGAIGVDISQSVGAQTFALLFCLLAQAAVAGWFFRGRFAIARTLPRYASVGQPFTYVVTVHNRTRKPYRHLELWEDFLDPRPELKEFAAALESKRRGKADPHSFRQTPWASFRRSRGGKSEGFSLPAKGRGETRVTLTPLRRGPLRLKGSILTRPDPLGLFRGWIKVAGAGTVLVLPKRYPVPSLVLPGTSRHQPGGVEFALSVGSSDQFVSLRDYRSGDPPRHIHWRSWAHANRPIVKEFQDESFVRHALVLDTFATAEQHEAFEEAVSVAASFACSVTTQESLLDLLLVGSEAICLTTGRGVGHMEQALELLACAQPAPEGSFDSLQHLVLRHAGQVCGCICVLLDWDEPRRALVRRLRGMGVPVIALVIASQDRANEIAGAMASARADSCHILEVGKVGQDLQTLEGLAA